MRYRPDGSLDSSFGGTGKVFTGVNAGTSSNGIVIQPDGKILVLAGFYMGANQDFSLLRYHPNGSRDLSFGQGGIVTTDLGGANDYANCVALQRDGRIVTAGSTYDGTTSSYFLQRYLPDGQRDFSLNSTGKFIPGMGGATSAGIGGISIQRNGKLAVTGSSSVAGGEWKPVLARFRTEHSGSHENSGPGADLNDPDGDGQVNLIEFATGGHPRKFTPPVGALVKNGDTLEFTYSRPTAAAAELHYQLQASITLSRFWGVSGVTSTVLSDDSVTQVVKATAPAGIGKRFVRLRVTRQ